MNLITTILASKIYILSYLMKQWKSNYGCDSKLTCLLFIVRNAFFWEKCSPRHVATSANSQAPIWVRTTKTGQTIEGESPGYQCSLSPEDGSSGRAPHSPQQPVLARVAWSRAEKGQSLCCTQTSSASCPHAPNTH